LGSLYADLTGFSPNRVSVVLPARHHGLSERGESPVFVGY
jgi:hypothetical protein